MGNAPGLISRGKFLPPTRHLLPLAAPELLQHIVNQHFLAMVRSLLLLPAMNVSMYQAAAALNANSRWQEVIAENLASSSIPGFRKQEISQAAVQAGLMPAGSLSNSKSPQY